MNLTYDAHGRLETTTQGERTSTRAYGLAGYLERVVDPLLQAHAFTTDAIGRVLTETRPDTHQVVSGWDAAGNPLSITPPGRPIHRFAVSPVDQLASYTPPDLPSGPALTTWDYDLDRKLERVTKPGGAVVRFGYDSAGRRTSATFPGGTITWSYDPATGKLAGVTGPAGVALAYGYDGPLLTDVSWSGAVAGAIHRAYDNDFQVSSESVNGAGAVGFGRDADGLLTTVGALTLSRDPRNGRVTGTSAGNVTETVDYNDFGDITRRESQLNDITVVRFEYIRDALGRIIERTETIQGETHVDGFGYDSAGRLEDVFRDGVMAVHYDFDTNGNRLSRTTSTGSESAICDDQDRLLRYGTKTYAYQDSGELISRTDIATGQTTRYDYSALGHLWTVTLPSGTALEYIVDGLGRRVGKKVGGTLVRAWLYGDALRPVAELDGAGAMVASFVYAEGVNVPDLMIKGGATYRIMTDAIGSVRVVVDASSGAVAQRLDYDDFGGVLLDTNPGFQPFGFAGGLYDADTKLVRFGARDYDAELGRWTTKDPMLFAGGMNLYVYCDADPMNCRDPSGHWPEWLDQLLDSLFGPMPAAPTGSPHSPYDGQECGPGDYCPFGPADTAGPISPGRKWREWKGNDHPGDNEMRCLKGIDEGDVEYCKRVKEHCVVVCSGYPMGGRLGQGFALRNCVNNCMHSNGC